MAGTAEVRSRKESQAATRARLIDVGRRHFIRDGIGGAVAEKVAAEAGYTRGALYANFESMEGLFLAVVQSGIDAMQANFDRILESEGSAESRLAMLREAVGDLVVDPAWVVLEAEFQAHALRNPALRMAYVAQQDKRRANGARLMRQFVSQMGLVLSASPEEVVAVLGSVAEGLAVRQAIAGEGGAEQSRRLAMLCFDRLVVGFPK